MKLPTNFELDKYGLHCRLVNEGDAEFINTLRSNPKIDGMIHTSKNDVEIQKRWIEGYKAREQEGTEYYFIFEKNSVPLGVYRIYNIDWRRLKYTGGSWICKPELEFEIVAKTILIADEVAFDILGLKLNLYEVQKINKKVIRFHRDVIGAEEYGENNDEILFYVSENIRKRNNIKSLLDLK